MSSPPPFLLPLLPVPDDRVPFPNSSTFLLPYAFPASSKGTGGGEQVENSWDNKDGDSHGGGSFDSSRETLLVLLADSRAICSGSSSKHMLHLCLLVCVLFVNSDQVVVVEWSLGMAGPRSHLIENEVGLSIRLDRRAGQGQAGG